MTSDGDFRAHIACARARDKSERASEFCEGGCWRRGTGCTDILEPVAFGEGDVLQRRAEFGDNTTPVGTVHHRNLSEPFKCAMRYTY